MSKARLILALLLGLAVLVAGGLWWDTHRSRDMFVAFDETGASCAIIVPGEATEQEVAAAQLLSETLAAAAGRGSRDFPVQHESWWRFWQWGIAVGNTKRAGLLMLPGKSRLERPVGVAVSPTGVILRSRWPEDIVAAAGWFLEKQLGARWFMPGPLGTSVSRRANLRLALGTESAAPSFVSRNLGGLNSPAESAWFGANRLQAVIAHGHSMSAIFKPEDVARMPELAPLLNWQKYVPTRSDEQEWQPNLAAESAAAHATGVLRHQFTDARDQVAVRLSMNDSIRYDQSQETQALVGPPRFFRQKPDYSNLVFGFANKVARELAAEFPDRFISTYAYDWTENVPGFRVEPNVIPYLTADRSQWFDPVFAAQDRDLIKRWVAAGPKVIGIYDYYEGAPHLVPRPTLYAVAQSIPFAYSAGVRAFYAEAFPNWGIDGPKFWLAAQLLWDAQQDPAALLDIYYRDYWQEAAGPMREFFALCDRQWLEQPLPSYWLKYFKDEHQALRFPPEVRLELRVKLEAAGRLARTEVLRQRLDFTSAAFAVTEAFCEFNEARDRLSRLALAATLDPLAVVTAAGALRQTREKLEIVLVRAKAKHPLAITAKLLEEYTRNDPRRRALWRLLRETAPDQTDTGFIGAFGDLLPAGGTPLFPSGNPGFVLKTASSGAVSGKELIIDSDLTRLNLRDVADFTALDWVRAGYWRGHGEPYETRSISLEQRTAPLLSADNPGFVPRTPSSGGFTGKAIHFAGCKQETLSQWHAAEGGALYAGTARVRAQVSPGNMTFLIITFLDGKGRYVGLGSIDRLPLGDWNEPVELAVLVRAPKEAKQIGLGVRVLNQVGADYAEFSALSLQRVE